MKYLFPILALSSAVSAQEEAHFFQGDLPSRDDSLTLVDAKKKLVFQSKDVAVSDAVVVFDLKKGGDVGSDGEVVQTVNVLKDDRDPSPFKFQKGDTVAIVGNGLADRMQHDGWTETLIQSAAPGMKLTFRNMSLTGDRPNNYPRSRGFTPMPQYLQQVGADVIIAMFGYNESFDTKPVSYTHLTLPTTPYV